MYKHFCFNLKFKNSIIDFVLFFQHLYKKIHQQTKSFFMNISSSNVCGIQEFILKQFLIFHCTSKKK